MADLESGSAVSWPVEDGRRIRSPRFSLEYFCGMSRESLALCTGEWDHFGIFFATGAGPVASQGSWNLYLKLHSDVKDNGVPFYCA